VPAVVRHTAATSPARHLEIAACLGAETRGATEADAGAILADALIALMKEIAIPNGLAGVGYDERDIAALVAGAAPQRRLLDNAPTTMTPAVLDTLFRGALSYW
jgi:alcohol dehydrogenase class IV